MKLIHHSKDSLTAGERFFLAKEYESQGELEKAALVYEKVVAESKLNEAAYNRLMIVYRKLKNYRKEAVVIDRAIREFEILYDHNARKKTDKKVTALSKALNKLTGLADKKGNMLYDPEPLGRWKKRKQFVAKRMKAL